MGLRFSKDKGLTFERKALTISNELQGILNQGPMNVGLDGALGFFEVFSASYGKLYKTQSALRSIVDFLARNIAQCKIRVFDEGSDGVSLPAPDHPVQGLLDYPQPGVPRSRFMRQLVGDKAIYDVAAIWKIRENFDPTPRPNGTVLNSGRVAHLVRIPVPYINVAQRSLVAPGSFRIMAGSDTITVPAEDMIWMPGYSPDSNINGVPPIETLRQILAEEFAAGKNQENFWKRGAALSLMFTQEGDSDLSDDAKERFREQWQNRYGGIGGTEARGTPIAPRGLKPFPLTIDAQSSEYLATRKLAREECCLAYGIQPQLLGITAANFASIDMFHQMLYQDTLSPWMVPIQEEFEEQLLREFEASDSGVSLDFNINAKLMGSFKDQAEIGQRAVGGPWQLADEFREKFLGLPPLPNGQGQTLITPSNVVRGGGPQANPLAATNQYTGKAVQLHLIDGATEGEAP